MYKSSGKNECCNLEAKTVGPPADLQLGWATDCAAMMGPGMPQHMIRLATVVHHVSVSYGILTDVIV